MSLTARDVAEILRVLEESSFDTLELEMNGVQLRLRRGGSVAPRAPTPLADASGETVRVAVATMTAPTVRAPALREDAVLVPAPLLGIFYRAPKPGEPPFVKVGDRVQSDTIIGIIEVMKLMNTVRAGVEGEIIEIPAVNGELVEFGQPLLWIRQG